RGKRTAGKERERCEAIGQAQTEGRLNAPRHTHGSPSGRPAAANPDNHHSGFLNNYHPLRVPNSPRTPSMRIRTTYMDAVYGRTHHVPPRSFGLELPFGKQ